MNPIHDIHNSLTRRRFFGQAGIGLAALSALLQANRGRAKTPGGMRLAASPIYRISRPKRSASFTWCNRAARRKSTCSIPSRT